MAWKGLMDDWRKKLFGTPYSVSGVRPATSAVSPNMYQRSFGDRPNIGYASAGKPTVQYGGGQPGMFKNPLGKMSPEELKDFQEVLKEMNLDMKPEFVAGGNYGRTQEYANQPFLFNEATAAEYQKRKKLFPHV